MVVRKRGVKERFEAFIRRERRKRIGNLVDKLVTSKTRKRYNLAVNLFCEFCLVENGSVPTEPELVDAVACAFIEALWEDGDPMSLANNLVAGLQHYRPRLRKKLVGSWQL